jgi:NADH dehydrogenase FAD-containing subunit
MTTQHVIIIGAGYAGLLCAIRLAGKTHHDQTRITLVNAGDHFIERIRLHQWLTGKPLPAHPIPRLLCGTGVEFVNGRVTRLDAAHQQITVATDAHEQHLSYDRLVYALGSQTDRWSVPGVSDHAQVLDGDSGQAFRAALPALAENNGRLLVVGGGLTAIETITELAETFPALRLTLLTNGTFGSELSPAGQAHLRTVFARKSIALIEGARVTAVEAGRALTADGQAIPFEACLWTVGFVAPPLAREAGLPVNERGQIKVDDCLRVPDHNSISVVGDSAAVDLPWGALRMGCVSAMPMGAYVADRLTNEFHRKDKNGHSGSPLPGVFADGRGAGGEGNTTQPFRFGFLLRCISLGRREGLVQMVGANDTPQPRIYTGWQAVLMKEIICRFTAGSMPLERRFPGFYRWPQPKVGVAAADHPAYAR